MAAPQPTAAGVQLQLLIRNGPATQHLCLPLAAPTTTVAQLEAAVAERTGVAVERLSVVFCGRRLDGCADVASLCLGPQTSLTVVVARRERSVGAQAPELSTAAPAASDTSTFFVYCKRCAQLRSGKLRAYCCECSGTSVVFAKEPQGWPDVLEGARHLRVECKQCAQTELPVSILFKCVDCGQSATPLRHVKRNTAACECVICGDGDAPRLVTLECGHSSCVECFTAYCQQLHAQMNLVVRAGVGYTVSCPVFGCAGHVRDVHHFYLLGMDAYKRYQQRSAMMFFAQQLDRHYCPSCSAAFTLEDAEGGEKTVLCPECSKLHCRVCLTLPVDGECKCESDEALRLEDISLETIRRTCKECPTCRAPTERSGGCAHIHCVQCKAEWCFICTKAWDAQCQWDHWFD